MVILPLSPFACALVTTSMMHRDVLYGTMDRNQNSDELDRGGDVRIDER